MCLHPQGCTLYQGDAEIQTVRKQKYLMEPDPR